MDGKRNLFDDLNEALFAQVDKLQSVDPSDAEQMRQTIEQSRAVSTLATNIINNANTAITLTKLRSEAENGLYSNAASAPKMLTGDY